MKKNHFKILILSFLILSFAFVLYADDSSILAVATKVKGTVTITDLSGKKAIMKTGGKIYKGESIKTGPDGKATLIFTDGEMRIITSNSELKFEKSDKKENMNTADKLSQTIAYAADVKSIETAAQSLTGAKINISSSEVPASKPMAVNEEPMASKTFSGEKNMDIQAPAPPPIPETVQANYDENQKSLSIPEKGYSKSKYEQTGGSVAERDSQKRAGIKSSDKSIDHKPAGRQSIITKYNLGLWYSNDETVKAQDIFAGTDKNSNLSFNINIFREQNMSQLATAEIKFSDRIELDKYLKDITGTNETIFMSISDSDFINPVMYTLKFNNYENQLIKDEMAFLEKIKNDDPETYLYLKASLFFKNKFYIAALKSVLEFEKINNENPTHMLNLKALIYSSTGRVKQAKKILNTLTKERER